MIRRVTRWERAIVLRPRHRRQRCVMEVGIRRVPRRSARASCRAWLHRRQRFLIDAGTMDRESRDARCIRRRARWARRAFQNDSNTESPRDRSRRAEADARLSRRRKRRRALSAARSARLCRRSDLRRSIARRRRRPSGFFRAATEPREASGSGRVPPSLPGTEIGGSDTCVVASMVVVRRAGPPDGRQLDGSGVGR